MRHMTLRRNMTTPSDMQVGMPLPHPRRLGWVRTAALAMGGSNQSLFLLGVLLVAQGTAAIPLLVIGLLLALAAMPGWIELLLMWPNRVGGVAAVCGEAFRPYSGVLANLAGTCYWWGWVPTCGLTSLLSAAALHEWYLPQVPVTVLAITILLVFTFVTFRGVRTVATVAVWIAGGAAVLAFLSVVIPVMTGHVDWDQATDYSLLTPFHGLFGSVTSAMAGLYLIGFAAPAFEAAGCHVGETIDPNRNVPRAFYASAAMAVLFFVAVPVVWLGVVGPRGLEGDIAQSLGPTFAPIFGGAARGAAVWLIVLNMFHGTLQPLAGASRTLAQLAEDGLLPRLFAVRSKRDVPWFATCLTAGMSIVFLLIGDPVWMIAAANLTYLIGISLPSVAVWLLRRHSPELHRPYRAPRGAIAAGLVAASVWAVSAVFGFEQFGLPTVVFGVTLAYSGAALYAWRVHQDKRGSGDRGPRRSLHVKLTGAMLLVMLLDSAGYLIAVNSLDGVEPQLKSALADIFVAVALVTISVGLVLPGMIAEAAGQVAAAPRRLATGTLFDLTKAMESLAAGDLASARARVDVAHITVHTADELGAMASSFNTMQDEVARTAVALDGARENLNTTHRHLQQAQRIGGLGSWSWRSPSSRMEWSDELHRILGTDPGHDTTFDNLNLLTHPDDRQRVLGSIQATAPSGVGFHEEYRIVRPNGVERFVEARGQAVGEEVEQATTMFVSVQDVTEQRQAASMGIRLAAIVESSRDAIIGVGLDGVVFSWNAGAERLFGYPTTDVLGHGLDLLAPFELLAEHDDLLARIAAGSPIDDFETVGRHRDGYGIAIGLTVSPTVDATGDLIGASVIVRDISERKELERQLTRQAFHDGLTGLANRALFRDRVQHAVIAAGRHPTGIAVLFLDLDGFKTVNDSLGHAAGDLLLLAVGERLQLCVRPGDTVARLGGDEFAILIDETSQTAAVAAAARVLKALDESVIIEKREVAVTASIGIVMGDSGDDADALLRQADTAMYAAKAAGKNRYLLFQAHMHDSVVERLELGIELQLALQRDELTLRYQPIMDLAHGNIAGVEALVRWQHPTRGLMLPGLFIPLAEETGLIEPIGRWVLDAACLQAVAWGLAGIAVPKMSVNLSGRQLQNAAVVDDVRGALQRSGLEPERLTLEITESVLMSDTVESLDRLRALKDLGVQISIDDFGTGYSSLSYLRRFPVDALKIDKSFVDDLGGRSDDTYAFVRAIVQLGHTLRLQTVAEGIEQVQQWDALREIGCDFGQGFLFAHPLTASEIGSMQAGRSFGRDGLPSGSTTG
jgi:diguanylate cyclase (GGDEF)-like protein/PAS domain S-box-containing protein